MKGSPRRVWRVVRRVWITLGLGATAVFVAWSLIAYRADREAREAWGPTEAVRVVEPRAGLREFTPRTRDRPEVRLVFFPGALVDPMAYAPLMQAVAEAGYGATLVALPRRGAFGGAESEELVRRVSAALRPSAEGQRIVVGGHSRGGVVASSVVASRASSVHGLVLIGTSHPRDVDLSGFDGPVAKIVGTRDGLASESEVRTNAPLLPPQTEWTWIDGGNHSQFGWYGFQPMDRRARIGEAEQRAIMIDGVLRLLARLVASTQESAAPDT